MPTMLSPLHMETHMMIKKVLAVATLTLSAGASNAWTLVYAHDASGAATSGSIQTLRNAINNGASVKVIIQRPTVHNWSVNCTNVSVRNDASQAVVCIGMWPLIVNTYIGAQFSNIITPAQTAHFTINTLGQYAQADVKIGDGSILNNSMNTYPMLWFVD